MERGIPKECLEEIIDDYDKKAALARCNKHNYTETRHILGGCLVIYNSDDPPAWLRLVLEVLGEDNW